MVNRGRRIASALLLAAGCAVPVAAGAALVAVPGNANLVHDTVNNRYWLNLTVSAGKPFTDPVLNGYTVATKDEVLQMLGSAFNNNSTPAALGGGYSYQSWFTLIDPNFWNGTSYSFRGLSWGDQRGGAGAQVWGTVVGYNGPSTGYVVALENLVNR